MFSPVKALFECYKAVISELRIACGGKIAKKIHRVSILLLAEIVSLYYNMYIISDQIGRCYYLFAP